MQALWYTLFYNPIYNALVWIMSHITMGDIGFAVIVLTIFVRLVLFPLSKKSVRSQIMMKHIAPLLAQLKKDYPNKEEQARKTFELYKQYNVNPFSGCLFVLVQLPIIFALYYVFYKGLAFASADQLYSFVQMPVNINSMFLGFVNVNVNHNIVLALLAGITQFIQGYLANPIKDKNAEEKDKKDKTFQEQMADSMAINIKYILPIFITFIAYKLSAAIAIYWVTSNLCTILQEWYVRKTISTTPLVLKAK
jgi:YidC/Oxa1 family membrane protein insertase